MLFSDPQEGGPTHSQMLVLHSREKRKWAARRVTRAPPLEWYPGLVFWGLGQPARPRSPVPQRLLRAHFCVCRWLSVWF